jgi:hypothetical protein
MAVSGTKIVIGRYIDNWFKVLANAMRSSHVRSCTHLDCLLPRYHKRIVVSVTYLRDDSLCPSQRKRRKTLRRHTLPVVMLTATMPTSTPGPN